MSARLREARPAQGAWPGSRPLQVSSRGRSAGGSEARAGLFRAPGSARATPDSSARGQGWGLGRSSSSGMRRGLTGRRAGAQPRPLAQRRARGALGAAGPRMRRSRRGWGWDPRTRLPRRQGRRLRGGISREGGGAVTCRRERL